MADFTRHIAMAKRLIAKYGTPVQVVYFTDGEPPDPLKPWIPGLAVETVVDTFGVMLTSQHVKFGLATDEQADEFSMANQERRVLIAGGSLSEAPNVKCELRIGGDAWKIVSVIPLGPGGTDIIYTVQVRR